MLLQQLPVHLVLQLLLHQLQSALALFRIFLFVIFFQPHRFSLNSLLLGAAFPFRLNAISVGFALDLIEQVDQLKDVELGVLELDCGFERLVSAHLAQVLLGDVEGLQDGLVALVLYHEAGPVHFFVDQLHFETVV